MQKSGLFITVEGVEGAGKSTQREFIAEWFVAKGYEVVCTREPGGTPLAEKVRELLLTPTDEPMDNKAELLLVFAGRAQHVAQVIHPALARGAVVISDRWVDSTYAYQGARQGLSYAHIDQLCAFVLGDFAPDMTFIFDIPIELGLTRAAARGRLDRFELEHLDFFTKVQLSFYGQLERNPARYRLIDAEGTREEVQAKLEPFLQELHARLNIEALARG